MPGRVSAAIEILTEVLERHRPASEALKDWGKAHRFAGSGDRHAIGTLVYDALRRKLSCALAADDDTPRGIVLGVLSAVWGMSLSDIERLSGEAHGIAALSHSERSALGSVRKAADHVRGDFPEWLAPSLTKVFADTTVNEMQALAQRAPIDLRTNTLKATRVQVLEALKRYNPEEGPLSPWSVRIAAPGPEARHISVESEPAHGMGWFEVQDSASQVAALLSSVKPGQRVADICAGAGGKTLALAAMMDNRGTLVAHDSDRRRLRPIFERMTRAGASCIEVIAADDAARLESPGGFDCVVIDAPCSGSGAWRRKPDSKWRLKPQLLEARRKDQQQVLARGAGLVRPGGKLVYITCSILPEENTEQVSGFIRQNQQYKLVPYSSLWGEAIGGSAPVSADESTDTLLLTPLRHHTDGFFVAVMQKAS